MKIQELGVACTGCGACAAACPTRAITMKPDSEGFLFPEIGESCIGCASCDRMCPVLNKEKKDGADAQKSDPSAFVACNKNTDERLSSSSGGIFILLAKSIISDGGTVYGAAVCRDMSVSHVCVSHMEELCRLQGSKYVQSKVGCEVYEALRHDIENGKAVLFSGTPCQCAAIRRYAGETDKLFTVSFMCHGVPSPKVWEKYLEEMKSVAESDVVKVSFRDKSMGWERFSMSLGFADGTAYISPLDKDPYLRAFLHNCDLRESCFNCAFKGNDGYSGCDILLSDWWSAQNGILPQKIDDSGTSAVFVMNDRGSRLWNKVGDGCVFSPAQFRAAVQSVYNSSPARPAARSVFIPTVFEEGFAVAADKYAKTPVKAKVRRLLVKTAKKLKIKRFIKKILGK